MTRMRTFAGMLSALFALATGTGCESGIGEPTGEVGHEENDATWYHVDAADLTDVPYDPGTCSSAEWQECNSGCDDLWCGARVDNCFKAWWYDGPNCVCVGGNSLDPAIIRYCGS
jgi:hypothetical protein